MKVANNPKAGSIKFSLPTDMDACVEKGFIDPSRVEFELTGQLRQLWDDVPLLVRLDRRCDVEVKPCRHKKLRFFHGCFAAHVR